MLSFNAYIFIAGMLVASRTTQLSENKNQSIIKYRMSCVLWLRKNAVMAYQQALKIRKKDKQSNRKKEEEEDKKTNTVPELNMLCNVQKYRYREIVYTFFSRLLLCGCLSFHSWKCTVNVAVAGSSMWAIMRTHAFQPNQPPTRQHLNFCEMRYCIVTTLKRGFLFIFESHLSYTE